MFSGSKKSVALKCIVKAPKSAREEPNITPTDESITSHTLTTDHGGLFSVKKTITTPNLANYLVRNDCVNLNLLDEIEWLFQSLEGRSIDNLDRPMKLSLHDCTDVTRSSRQRTISVPVI